MQQVAVLGVGTMGSGMAVNLARKGFGVSVYNRTRSKAEPLGSEGVRVAGTPGEAARDADIVIAMVADDSASRHIWLDAGGALESMKPGAVVVESSTVSPDWIQELAKRAIGRGLGFLDSPVGGSKQAAADGQLVLFVGGDSATLEKARPVLTAISRTINHLGPVGAGSTWKLINNMMVATHVAALAEALAFAGKVGIDMNQAAGLIGASAMASGIVQMKLPRMTEHRFGEADFALRHMLKDTRYALNLAREKGVELGIVRAASGAYQRGEEKGLGDLDFSAVIETLGQPAAATPA